MAATSDLHFEIPACLHQYVKENKYTYGPFTVYTLVARPTKKIGDSYVVQKRGPDDTTYEIKGMLEHVPRGYSRLYCNELLTCELSGMQKFYSLDIDNDDLESDKPDNKPLIPVEVKKWAEASKLHVQFQHKENGKFVIFRLFTYESEIYIFGGSKNMHIVRKLERFNPTDSLAEVILSVVIDDLLSIPKEELESILDRTIFAEYVDGHHIVFTSLPYIVYFNGSKSLRGVREILPSIDCLPTEEFLMEIRNRTHEEGSVIVYTNIETGEIIRQKFKTYWYIIWRCWREVICHQKSNDNLVKLMIRRLHQRSDQFMHLSDNLLLHYESQARLFVDWLSEQTFPLSALAHDGSMGMAIAIHRFELPMADRIIEELNAKDLEQKEEKLPIYTEAIINSKLKFCIILRGVPGCGKTTYAEYLRSKIEDCSIHSTDSYFVVDGEYKFDKSKLAEYHKANLESFKASKARVVIVDNTNLVPKDYGKYILEGYIRIIISFAIPSTFRSIHNIDKPHYKQMCELAQKHKPAPSYYGVFVDPADIDIPFTQKTPLHLTCKFVGGDVRQDIPPFREKLGMMVPVSITGLSKNLAGDALIATSDLGGTHITLITNPGCKPVDVGENLQQVEVFEKKIIGYYLPYY